MFFASRAALKESNISVATLFFQATSRRRVAVHGNWNVSSKFRRRSKNVCKKDDDVDVVNFILYAADKICKEKKLSFKHFYGSRL
jgi:hypothetical protein